MNKRIKTKPHVMTRREENEAFVRIRAAIAKIVKRVTG